jgi:hypothetical protein
MRRIPCALVLLICFAGGWSFASAQTTPPQGAIEIAPQLVTIDLGYNGATVNVRAEVPAGYEAAVLLAAHPGRLELKRLGKKGGLLWMGVGQVSFENVPAVYQVLTSAPLSELGSPQSLAKWKLGYESLVPDNVPGASLRTDLVGLKEHEGLFALQPRGLTRSSVAPISHPVIASVSEPGNPTAGAAAAGAVSSIVPQMLQGSFRLPARAPSGEYTVELIGFKDKQAVHLASATLRLENVGMAMKLKRLAIEHGLAYGISACVIAIIVGLLTGLLFRPKSDESH